MKEGGSGEVGIAYSHGNNILQYYLRYSNECSWLQWGDGESDINIGIV